LGRPGRNPAIIPARGGQFVVLARVSRPDLDPFRDHFPLQLGRVQIDLVDAPAEIRESKPDEIWAPVRVIEFDVDGSVRDIIEQSLRLAPHPNMIADAERVGLCIAAHVEVLTELFARPNAFDHGAAMPSELLFFDQLLAQRTTSSREQFVAALRAKRRLGKWLG
jgi:hypothetical protein